MPITQTFSAGQTDYVQALNNMVSQINGVEGGVDAAKLNAQASASQAAASAASAASVVQQDLGALDRAVFASITLVHAVIYDTSHDSDGGAWRKRCRHTSWYNEAINGNWLGSAANETAARAINGAVTGSYYFDTTANQFRSLNAGSGSTNTIRGNVREFPARALITAEAARVVIWDLTQPGVPMWMVFYASESNSVWSYVGKVAMLNGRLAVCSTNSRGVTIQDFVADRAKNYKQNVYAFYRGRLADRGASLQYLTVGTTGIVHSTLNDVAMAVLPNARVDVRTGLPLATVAVATPGGVSVIQDDGSITHSASTSGYSSVHWDGLDLLAGASGATAYTILSAYPGYLSASFGVVFTNSNTSVPALRLGSSHVARGRAIGNTAGLNLLRVASGDKSKSMVAYITHLFSSGWLPGDIRGAWLASNATETLSAPGTDPDRSVKAINLTAVGSITKAAVAAGADLVSYSAWSGSNYLEQAYSANLDYGTGDFCYLGWLKVASGAAAQTVCKRVGGLTASLGLSASGYAQAIAAGVTVTFSTPDLRDGTWHLIAVVRRAGVLEVWVDGRLGASSACTGTVTDATGVLRLGEACAANTELALWRTTATAPSAEQMAHIHQTERALFEAGAACVLAGASSAITNVARDPVTGIIHAITSWGRSAFRGLRRIESEATPVGTPVACAASGGAVAQLGASSADIFVPAMLLREELERDAEVPSSGQQATFEFDATTSQTTFKLPAGYRTKRVWSAGSLKREGSTKDWTRSWDGFAESVVFAVAPGNGVWVSAEAERIAA